MMNWYDSGMVTIVVKLVGKYVSLVKTSSFFDPIHSADIVFWRLSFRKFEIFHGGVPSTAYSKEYETISDNRTLFSAP